MNQTYVDHQAYEWEGCFESLENSFVSVELHHKTLCHATELISLRTFKISTPKIALPNNNSTWTRSTIRNSEKTICKMDRNSQGRGRSSSPNWLACFQLRAADPIDLTKQNPIMPSRLNLQPMRTKVCRASKCFTADNLVSNSLTAGMMWWRKALKEDRGRREWRRKNKSMGVFPLSSRTFSFEWSIYFSLSLNSQAEGAAEWVGTVPFSLHYLALQSYRADWLVIRHWHNFIWSQLRMQ
jgi:hypothetical protein